MSLRLLLARASRELGVSVKRHHVYTATDRGYLSERHRPDGTRLFGDNDVKDLCRYMRERSLTFRHQAEAAELAELQAH